MAATILQHSDQIVATLAKLPMSYFGSFSALRVASNLADSLMKDQDWSIAMRVKTLAGKAECVPRTVQRAMKRMTANGLFEVKHRKHPTIENFNYASVYKLGPVLRALCEQAVRRGRQACQGISLMIEKNAVRAVGIRLSTVTGKRYMRYYAPSVFKDNCYCKVATP